MNRGIRRCLALLMMLVTLEVTGCSARGPAVTADNPQGRAAIFDFVWSVIAEGNPILADAPVCWSEARERYRDTARDSPPAEFYRLLAKMVFELEDPHTSITFPCGIRCFSPGTTGVWVYAGRRAVLLADDWSPMSQHDRSYPVLIEVDGLSVAGERVAALVFARHPHRFRLRTELADGSEEVIERDSIPRSLNSIEIDAASVHRAAITHPPLMYGTWLRTPATTRFRIDLSGADNADAAATPRPWIGSCENPLIFASPPDEVSLWLNKWSGPWNPRSLPWWIAAEDLGTTGYLRISTFSERLAGVSAARIAYLSRKAVDSLAHRDRLIIDLRYNYGGNSDAVFGLLPSLVRQSFATNLDGYRWIAPQPGGYRGRIVVLVNSQTASGGEWLAYLLRRYADATIVGERTSGAELGTETATAPDGTEVRYSHVRIMELGRDSFQRVGLQPDIEVPLSLDRVRQIGYVEAVTEVERQQFRRACEALTIDGDAVLDFISRECAVQDPAKISRPRADNHTP